MFNTDKTNHYIQSFDIFPLSEIYLNVVLFPVVFNHAILMYPETSAIKDRAETLHVNLRINIYSKSHLQFMEFLGLWRF